MKVSLIPEICSKYSLNTSCCVEEFIDTDDEMTQFVQKHIQRQDLQVIIISGRDVGNFTRKKVVSGTGVRSLGQLTQNNPNLKVLVFNGHRLDKASGVALVDGLKNNQHLVCVDRI
eukprot:UN02527